MLHGAGEACRTPPSLLHGQLVRPMRIKFRSDRDIRVAFESTAEVCSLTAGDWIILELSGLREDGEIEGRESSLFQRLPAVVFEHGDRMVRKYIQDHSPRQSHREIALPALTSVLRMVGSPA